MQISRLSGATVTTRGRYMSEDELVSAEPGCVVIVYVVLLIVITNYWFYNAAET